MSLSARFSVGLAALLLLGCGDDLTLVGTFNGPDATALLPVGEMSPFRVPVAFVANTRDGRIIPLDLKRGTPLSDQAASPFLAPRSVATGDQRQLGQLAVWSPDGQRIEVFAADLSRETLVQATYSQGLDASTGSPVPPALNTTAPIFEDVDGSGDSVRVADLRLRNGWSTTEDWIFEYDGSQWWAYGEHSGKQAQTATFDQRWSSDNKEVVLTLKGTATEGDRLTFRTETGLIEHDVGGIPLAVTAIPQTDWLALGVWDPDSASGSVVIWDAATGSPVGELELDEGGQPWRIVADHPSGALFVADARQPRVLRIPFDPQRPDLLSASVITTREIPMDLAVVSESADEASGRDAYDHLFVAGARSARVDVYDLERGVWLDPNPLDDIDAGLDLRSPVVGLSTAPLPIRLQDQSADGVRREAKVVAVTTFDGAVRLLEGATGCLAITADGPRVSSDSGYEQIAFDDSGPLSNPILQTDSATGRQIVTDRCGGALRIETWSITFDGVEGNWLVEGSATGVQANRAWPDERYVTDQGEFSFLILAGTSPASDGDRFEFTMDDGTLRLDQILDGDGTSDPIELPARPLAFMMEAGPQGGGWNADRRQVHLLVPATNADAVVRIRPQSWQADFKYE